MWQTFRGLNYFETAEVIKNCISVRTTSPSIYIYYNYSIQLVLAVFGSRQYCPCLFMQLCLERAGRAASQSPRGTEQNQYEVFGIFREFICAAVIDVDTG